MWNPHEHPKERWSSQTLVRRFFRVPDVVHHISEPSQPVLRIKCTPESVSTTSLICPGLSANVASFHAVNQHFAFFAQTRTHLERLLHLLPAEPPQIPTLLRTRAVALSGREFRKRSRQVLRREREEMGLQCAEVFDGVGFRGGDIGLRCGTFKQWREGAGKEGRTFFQLAGRRLPLCLINR
jgi:hypothetical protein